MVPADISEIEQVFAARTVLCRRDATTSQRAAAYETLMRVALEGENKRARERARGLLGDHGWHCAVNPQGHWVLTRACSA